MTTTTNRSHETPLLVLAWLAVGVPLAWGVFMTLVQAAKLFA